MRLLDPKWVKALPGLFGALLLAPLLLERVQSTPGLLWAFVAAAVLGVSANYWLVAERKDLEVEWRPRAPHVLQIFAQGAAYGYWAWHWPPTQEQLLLVLAQLPFAYLIEMFIGWRRYGRFRLGFGPFPIVGSINLFLWMTDAWWGLQLGMVGIAYLARELLQWERDGVRQHIFNPSAIALVAVALPLILTGNASIARGQEIASSLGLGPYCYESMLLAGLIVQLAFPVVLTTMAAFATTFVLGWLYTAQTGVYHYVDTTIPIAVFLGMTLLITDPVSSPKSSGGKVLFGVLYGLGVFVLFDVLWAFNGLPWGENITYFDKLLCVPLLNLAVPLIEPLGKKLSALFAGIGERLGERRSNYVHVGVWLLIYVLARPALTAHPGREVELWRRACAQQKKPAACEKMAVVWQTRCATEAPEKRQKGCEEVGEMLLEPACEHGIQRACAKLALRQAATAPEKAAPRLQKACEAGEFEACGQLGALHMKGAGVKKDEARAEALLQKACEAKVIVSCEHLGTMLQQRNTPADNPRAAALFARGCKADLPVSCATLGLMYLTGQAGAQDPAKAKVMLKKACGKGLEPACKLLSQVESMGGPPGMQPPGMQPSGRAPPPGTPPRLLQRPPPPHGQPRGPGRPIGPIGQ